MSFEGKFIYKIKNKKNEKIYIGQSINPEKRFNSHMVKRIKSVVENNKFNEDVMKYNKEDFELEILGFYKNYNEMEEFFIEKFNSIKNGYNVNSVAICPPVKRGEDSPSAKLSFDDVTYIKNEIKNNITSTKIIGKLSKQFKVETSTIERINNGKIWYDENEKYPLKPNWKDISRMIKEEILKGLNNLKEISINLNVSHSRVKAVNSGQNHKEDKYKYPLRANLDYNKAVSTISLIGE